MANVAIVADDLTGASDTGIKFLESGYQTSVVINYKNLSIKDSKEILSLNTNTRELDSEEAYKIVNDVYLQLKEMNYQYFYKKIDSVFRGNIGQELDAMMDALDYNLALLIPAIPSNGRVIMDGYLNVISIKNGQEKIVNKLYLPQYLQEQTKKKIGLITLDIIRSGVQTLHKKFNEISKLNQIIIFDTETEDDLNIISQLCKQINKSYALVGASGIASYIPEIWDLQPKARDNKVGKTINNKKTLLVAGSFNNETSKQVQCILKNRQEDVALIQINTNTIITDGKEAELCRVKKQIKSMLCEEEKYEFFTVAVDTLLNKSIVVDSKYSDDIADTVAEVGNILIKTESFDKLILTGGDTAYRVFEKIGSSEITLIDEIIPGIPAGIIVDGKAKGDMVVTKSGGFGTEDTFVKITEYLDGKGSE